MSDSSDEDNGAAYKVHEWVKKQAELKVLSEAQSAELKAHFKDEDLVLSEAGSPTGQEKDVKLQREGLQTTERGNIASSLDIQTPTSPAVFTHEKGGVLQESGSDVKLTVPPGAVPKGKTYMINRLIHTNLADFMKCIPPDEIIVGPVVEMNVEEGGSFKLPVTIQVPHCVPAGEVDDIRAWYGTGKDLKEIKNDKKSIQCKRDECFVEIYTTHFTKFILSYWRSITIENVLLTVSAPSDSKRKTVELRVALHTLCSMLKDFRKERAEIYDPGMEEIKTMKVTLPGTSSRIHFPKIIPRIVLKENSHWKVQEPADASQINITYQNKWMEVTIEGQNVMKVNDSGLNSQQLRNFIVERTLDDSTPQALDCTLSYVFRYVESDIPDISDSMAVIWPTTFQPTCSHTERARHTVEAAKRLREEDIEQVAERLKDKFKQNMVYLNKNLEYLSLTGHITQSSILQADIKENVDALPTRGEQIEHLLSEALPRRPPKDVVLFAKALIETGQGHHLQNIEILAADYECIRTYHGDDEIPAKKARKLFSSP